MVADGTLVCPEKPPLEQRSRAMDMGQEVPPYLWRVTGYRVVVACRRKPAVAAKAIRHDVTATFN